MYSYYKESVIRSFKENFEKYKDRRIVLYGTAVVAGYIMEAYHDYNIIGFLDGSKNYGTAYGKKIFSYEELVEANPDLIIVAAHRNSMQVIYERICYLCYTHGIPIYAIDGRNLFTSFGYKGLNEEQLQYRDISVSMLEDQIRSHDIICFELFDVLLIRKSWNIEDILEIVSDRLQQINIIIPDFLHRRLQAEQAVMKDGRGGTIEEIYDYMVELAGIPVDMAERAKQVELETENNLICRRDKMRELYLLAAQLYKKIYVVEDTYLPREFVKGLLDKHGFNSHATLVLSSDHRLDKRELLNMIKEESRGSSCLHIGADEDNYDEIGIDTFRILSVRDIFQLSTYRHLEHSLQSINERSMAGMLISKVFNNPFSIYGTEGRPRIERAYDFGYAFVAPLITKYVFWLIDQMSKGIYRDILFAARDGYLIHKLYQYALRELRLKLPLGIYFYTSRAVCLNAAVKSELDIQWIAEVPFADTPEQMLMRRFNLMAEEIIPFDESKHNDVVSYVLEHKDIILARAESLRQNYITYMKKIGIVENEHYAFADFVSSGTCQLMLSRIMPLKLHGQYLCRYYVDNEARMQLPIESLFYNLIGERFFCGYTFEYYFLLETMMTSSESTLASFTEHGDPVLAPEVRGVEELQYVQEIHQAIEDYFRDFVSHMYIRAADIHKHFVDTILSYHDRKYTDECCSVFDRLMLVDDFRQGRIPLERSTLASGLRWDSLQRL